MYKSISSFFHKKAETQRAVAILKAGVVYLQSYSKTDQGVWIGYGRVITAKAYDLDTLSISLKKIISMSTQGILHPNNWHTVQQPMLDATASKNWKNLSVGAKAVGISCENEIMSFTPCKNYASEGGIDLVEKTVHVGIEESSLGETLMKAFELCES